MVMDVFVILHAFSPIGGEGTKLKVENNTLQLFDNSLEVVHVTSAITQITVYSLIKIVYLYSTYQEGLHTCTKRVPRLT